MFATNEIIPPVWQMARVLVEKAKSTEWLLEELGNDALERLDAMLQIWWFRRFDDQFLKGALFKWLWFIWIKLRDKEKFLCQLCLCASTGWVIQIKIKPEYLQSRASRCLSLLQSVICQIFEFLLYFHTRYSWLCLGSLHLHLRILLKSVKDEVTYYRKSAILQIFWWLVTKTEIHVYTARRLLCNLILYRF